jgi:hypothetical protein
MLDGDTMALAEGSARLRNKSSPKAFIACAAAAAPAGSAAVRGALAARSSTSAADGPVVPLGDGLGELEAGAEADGDEPGEVVGAAMEQPTVATRTSAIAIAIPRGRVGTRSTVFISASRSRPTGGERGIQG